QDNDSECRILVDYLKYMTQIIDYPFGQYELPDQKVMDYVQKTKNLFLEAVKAPSPKERYSYAKEIYLIIKDLIPDDSQINISGSLLPDFLPGKESHDIQGSSINQVRRRGQSQMVTTRLFVDLNGQKKDLDDNSVRLLFELIKSFELDEDRANQIKGYKGFKLEHTGSSLGASALHRDMKVIEKHPKINMNLAKAYQNIYEEYKLTINSYNSRFHQLLKVKVPVEETKFKFGKGIDSRRMGDVKKNFWYRKVPSQEIPDLSIMLLIDGSGSMQGERRKQAMISSLILHEVLKKQGIEHAIVEHRGNMEDELKVDMNVLVDFNFRDEEKYNIMLLKAESDNRDGLALYWAEKYMNKKSSGENKIIIVLSDGYPAHRHSDYYPPVSVKDTANAVKKISSRGINVIAVSLDEKDEFSTYESLKEIYPLLIGCNDLKNLTRQLLQIISRELK
ncbi:MAG: VWA domain-containing protein, partial [Treponemataceae bacterium]|nr:VWA domain-containing protein [Treponemataceae bacterium]